MSSNPLIDGLRRWRPTADGVAWPTSVSLPRPVCADCGRWPEMRYTNRRLTFTLPLSHSIMLTSQQWTTVNIIDNSDVSDRHPIWPKLPETSCTTNPPQVEVMVLAPKMHPIRLPIWESIHAAPPTSPSPLAVFKAPTSGTVTTWMGDCLSWQVNHLGIYPTT